MRTPFQKKHILLVEVATRGVKLNPEDWEKAGTYKRGFVKKKKGPQKKAGKFVSTSTQKRDLSFGTDKDKEPSLPVLKMAELFKRVFRMKSQDLISEIRSKCFYRHGRSNLVKTSRKPSTGCNAIYVRKN